MKSKTSMPSRKEKKRDRGYWMALVVAVLALAPAAQPSCAGDEQPKGSWKVTVSTAPTHVLSYPFIVRVRSCNEGVLSALGIGQNLSSGRLPMTTIKVQLARVDGVGKPIVFGVGFDRVQHPPRRVPSAVLDPGECVSSTVDLFTIGGARVRPMRPSMTT